MKLVARLSYGWKLLADQGYPLFVNRDGRRRSPRELSRLPEARTIFREVKRYLDVADLEVGREGVFVSEWRAADKAKLSLQIELIRMGLWNNELLETGVEAA